MATNHEVGSSNLSERATQHSLKEPLEHGSGAFLVSEGAPVKDEKTHVKFVKNPKVRHKVRHSVRHGEPFLSIAEAAERLGKSISTVTRWCESGHLPAIPKPYGKRTTYQISPQAIEMFLYEQEQEQKEAKEAQRARKPHSDYTLAWEKAMAKGLMTGKPFSPNTIELYTRNVNSFLSRHKEVSAENLQRALMVISPKQFAKKIRLYEAVVCFGKFLIRNDALDSAFLEHVTPLKPKRHLPPKRTTVDAEGLVRLMAACETELDKLIIILLANTGIRASEACALLWSDIHLDKGYLVVRLGKGNKTRLVGLPPTALDALEAYRQTQRRVTQTGPVLLNRLGKPMDRHGLRQRVERLGEIAGLKVTPHALRRAFVTINAGLGRSLVHLQKACGHSNITTTMGYCLTSEQEVIDAMKKWD